MWRSFSGGSEALDFRKGMPAFDISKQDTDCRLTPPLRTFECSSYLLDVASVIYLAPGKEMPDVGDEGRWLIIEANDGKFFGTGGSWKRSGEWVGYGSLSENDVSLDAALAAARQWAEKYDVPTIWIQLAP
jgi:hypothetical protein